VKSDALSAPLEKILGAMLYYGTCLASFLIALGLMVAIQSAAAGISIAAIGIALFIAIPVLRVATMLAFFLRSRDYRFSGIAVLVLGIILVSYLIGAR
jgi:uncharacterized membrane protein